MKVLVCGGSKNQDWGTVFETLDKIHEEHPIAHVVNGGAVGVDSYSTAWARSRSVPFTEYPAEWTRYGNPAGAIRNQKMLEISKPDLVIAFPGGNGTAHLFSIAQRAKVKVHIINATDESDEYF
jgi:hypothetical protein